MFKDFADSKMNPNSIDTHQHNLLPIPVYEMDLLLGSKNMS
jgi:hypothetical protein